MSFFYKTQLFLEYVQHAKRHLQDWHSTGTPYLIYGAGVHTLELLKHIQLENSSFAGFIDQSLLKQTNGLNGYPVYAPEKATTLPIKAVLISSYEFQAQIQKYLEDHFHLLEIASLYTSQKKETHHKELFLMEKTKTGDGTKKIAVVDTFFSWPPIGGSSVDLAMVMNHLVQSGYHVTFFLPKINDALYSARGRILSKEGIAFNIVHVPFEPNELNPGHFTAKLGQEIEDYGPEYLFLGDMYAYKPYLANHLKQYKVIWRSYNYDLVCPRMNLINSQNQTCQESFLATPETCQQCIEKDSLVDHDHPIFREIKQAHVFTQQYQTLLKENIQRAHALIIYNDILGDRLKNYFGNLPGLTQVPTGIVLNESVSKIKKQKKERPITLFFPGRVEDPTKGFEFLQDVFKELRKKYPTLKLICTGKFAVGINGIVSSGWIPGSEVWELYKSSDICVIPSLWEEPFGIVTLEAMWSGLPVVASAVGGIKQTMIHKETGFLAAPGDKNGFFKALEKLIIDPDLRSRMGENGRKRARKYSWENVMKRYANVFTS